MEPLGKGDPRRVGPYRLRARLGGGGTGTVYLGRSRGGRPVAVKVVRPELAADPGFRRRFTIEVQAARRVGGFHTAQVVDADPDTDPPWLVTAHIPGPTLYAAVQDEGALPPESVVSLGAGPAEGLAAIHACGLVHRDLKPSNVILADDGPRVIDPGHSPFGTGPAHAVMYRVVHDRPALAGVPKSLRKLIASCLAKDPGRRPTVADVLSQLTAHQTAGSSSPPASHSGPRVNPEPGADKSGLTVRGLPEAGPAADRVVSTAAGSTAPRFPFVGGFGLSDVVNPAERCPDCGSEGALPTDLFCGEHDRFLPLVNRVSVGRIGIVLSASVLVYAFLWLAAALESSVPALLAIAAIGLLAYLLPLRTHHVRTVGPAAIAYVITFGATFLINATDGDARQRLVSVVFLAGMTMPAVHAGLRVLGKAESAEQFFADGPLLVFIALGGWLFTTFSLVGLGDVRAGWATWTATALLTGALAWYQLPHRKNR